MIFPDHYFSISHKHILIMVGNQIFGKKAMEAMVTTKEGVLTQIANINRRDKAAVQEYGTRWRKDTHVSSQG